MTDRRVRLRIGRALVWAAAVAAGAFLSWNRAGVDVTPAHAQTAGTAGTTTTGTAGTSGSLAASDFNIRLLRQTSPGKFTDLSDLEQTTFFNLARCQCPSDQQFRIRVEPTASGRGKQGFASGAYFRVYLSSGTSCVSSDTSARLMAIRDGRTCKQVGQNVDLQAFLQGNGADLNVPLSSMYPPSSDSPNQTCGSVGQGYVVLYVNASNADEPSLFDTASPQKKYTIDISPPPAPTDVTVTGGNEALQVSWSGLSGVTDLNGFLVFCSRGENLQVFKDSYYKNQYTSCATGTGAGAGGSTDTGGSTGTGGDAGTGGSASAAGAGGTTTSPVLTYAQADDTIPVGKTFAAPAQFTNLDPNYVCHNLVTTQKSVRIDGLQNGAPYLVGVSAVDRSGNASPIKTVVFGEPVPTRDFLAGYKEAGGEAEGGYCTFSGGKAPARFGLAGLGALAALTLTLRSRLRR